MTLEQLRHHLTVLYLNEKDERVKKMLDDIWREIPASGEIRDIPCKIGRGKTGYKFKAWIRDDWIPRGTYPWGYDGDVLQKTYALVEDPSGRIIRVKPEKIKFDNREAERWDDLHG